MNANIVALLYLVSGVLFIMALRGLSSPATSRQGNLFGMVGMAIAVLTTLSASPPAGIGAMPFGIVALPNVGRAGSGVSRALALTDSPPFCPGLPA